MPQSWSWFVHSLSGASLRNWPTFIFEGLSQTFVLPITPTRYSARFSLLSKQLAHVPSGWFDQPRMLRFALFSETVITLRNLCRKLKAISREVTRLVAVNT